MVMAHNDVPDRHIPCESLSPFSTPYSRIWLVGIMPMRFKAFGTNSTCKGLPVKLMLRGNGSLIVTRLSGIFHLWVSARKSLKPGLMYG